MQPKRYGSAPQRCSPEGDVGHYSWTFRDFSRQRGKDQILPSEAGRSNHSHFLTSAPLSDADYPAFLARSSRTAGTKSCGISMKV